MSVPGNQNAYANKPWADALRRAMARYQGGKKNALNLIADQTVKLAVQGEQWAIKEIGDRTDGKAAQSVMLSGDENNPVVFKEVRRTIVKPK
jgi:hypothetical protein